MKLRVWTHAYRPFIMGGNTNRPVATCVEVIEEKQTGKITLFSFKTPKGAIRVAEKLTGAIVGDSIESVEKDLLNSDPKLIEDQLQQAKLYSEQAETLDSEAFFSLYRF